MREPLNPNGRPNAEVLKPYWNGDDLTARPRDVWLIDLPLGLTKAQAAQYAAPFAHLASTPDENGKVVEELRKELGDRAHPRWWEPHWPRPEMRSRIERLERYLVTAETAQHRVFIWLSYPVLPDKNLIVIPRDDDLMFGLLQNRFHTAWSLRKGSDLEDRPRYTHTTTFATYPFPDGMSPDDNVAVSRNIPTAAAIEAAARDLNNLRENWLYPADLVVKQPEVVDGMPARRLPKNPEARQALGRRTLTTLYNERPEWLIEAHRTLDESVAAAYGWPKDITDDAALGHLLDLNLQRSALARGGGDPISAVHAAPLA